MSRFYSAGYYKKHNNTVRLIPNSGIAEGIKRFITPNISRINYNAVTDTLFQIKGDMLIAKK